MVLRLQKWKRILNPILENKFGELKKLDKQVISSIEINYVEDARRHGFFIYFPKRITRDSSALWIFIAYYRKALGQLQGAAQAFYDGYFILYIPQFAACKSSSL